MEVEADVCFAACEDATDTLVTQGWQSRTSEVCRTLCGFAQPPLAACDWKGNFARHSGSREELFTVLNNPADTSHACQAEICRMATRDNHPACDEFDSLRRTFKREPNAADDAG